METLLVFLLLGWIPILIFFNLRVAVRAQQEQEYVELFMNNYNEIRSLILVEFYSVK